MYISKNKRNMVAQIYLISIVLLVYVTNRVLCENIKKTEIKIVTDENRYFALNPNTTARAFRKVNHAKGNIIFTSGERIDGDHLIITFMDETTFARLTDIEVSLWYPAEGRDGQIISCVEFVTDLSTSDSEVYFLNDGGIGSTYAEILMAANRTSNFGYQIYLYGY